MPCSISPLSLTPYQPVQLMMPAAATHVHVLPEETDYILYETGQLHVHVL